jgi:hypothetical protein
VFHLDFTMQLEPPRHSDSGLGLTSARSALRSDTSGDSSKGFLGTIFASYRPMPLVPLSCVHVINRCLDSRTRLVNSCSSLTCSTLYPRLTTRDCRCCWKASQVFFSSVGSLVSYTSSSSLSSNHSPSEVLELASCLPCLLPNMPNHPIDLAMPTR